MDAPSLESTHLERLVRLRWLAIAGQITAILGAHYGLGLALPLGPMLAAVAALAALNVGTTVYLRRAVAAVTQRGLALQLLADLLALTALLYLSGGHANPFMSMLLPLLAVAAAALSGWYTGAIALAAVLCYSLLLVSFVPIPALERGSGPWDPETLQLAGIWSCFVLSAAMILYFVLRTRASLRAHERATVAARERAMRQAHLASLGSLAASTAHELASPLATVKLMVDELDAVPPVSAADRRARVRELAEQVDRCNAALRQLLEAAGEPGVTKGSVAPAMECLQQFLSRARKRHPDVQFEYRPAGGDPAPHVIWDDSLEQALMHLVDNAAQVGDRVSLGVQWTASKLILRVLDNGPGIPPELLGKLGREPLADSPQTRGRGLGAYLACASVEHFGGSLEFSSPQGGGAVATVELPLPDLTPRHGESSNEPLAATR